MPRANTGPRLQLFGPDTKYGATACKGFARYLYYIVWTENHRSHKRSTGTDELEAAQAELSAHILSATKQPSGPSDPHETLILAAVNHYLTEYAPTTVDPARISYAVDALLPFWGSLPVSTITANTRRRYAKDRAKSNATVRRELSTLDAACRYCVTEGYLTSYATGQWLPPKTPPKEKFLEPSEAARLLRAARSSDLAGSYLPLFILIGLYTGARKEAIITLQWQPNTTGGWVDLEKGLIDFSPIGHVQSNKRRSLVRIPPRLLPFLRYMRKRTRQYLFEQDNPTKGNGVPAKIGIASVRTAWRTAAVRAGFYVEKKHLKGVDKGKVFKAPSISPHILRHTCVTWMMRKRVPIWQVAGFVGMSEEMIRRVYGHHSPDFLREASEAFGGTSLVGNSDLHGRYMGATNRNKSLAGSSNREQTPKKK